MRESGHALIDAARPLTSPTPAPTTPEPSVPSGLMEDRPTLAELERRYIALVLSECGGNKKKAAEKLGIDRRTLYRALERGGEDGGDADGDD